MAQYQICISLPQCADGRRDVDAERGDGEVEEDEAEGEDGLKGTRVNSNSVWLDLLELIHNLQYENLAVPRSRASAARCAPG